MFHWGFASMLAASEMKKYLALNEEKTEVVLFGPSDFYDGSNLDHW